MQRVNNSFSAKIEEKVLLKLVPLVPSWVTPDFLTFSAVIFALLCGIFYVASFYSMWFLLGVNICLLLNWFSDSTDGKVAVYRKMPRPNYGYYIDHMMDSFCVVFIIGGLALSHLSNTPAYYFTGFAALLCLINAFLKTPIFKAFYISIGRIGPTDGRIILFIANFIVFLIGNYSSSFLGMKMTLVDITGWTVCIMLLLVLVYDVYKTAMVLNWQDRLKWSKKSNK